MTHDSIHSPGRLPASPCLDRISFGIGQLGLRLEELCLVVTEVQAFGDSHRIVERPPSFFVAVESEKGFARRRRTRPKVMSSSKAKQAAAASRSGASARSLAPSAKKHFPIW